MRQLNVQAIDRSSDHAYPVLRAIQGITERTRVQEVRQASEDLNHGQEQVPQRQAELMHALRINTVGKLATGLAHELNQPLSSIANGVEACACYVRSGKATSHELLALLDDVSAEALRAGRIVKHLRAFIENGTPAFEPTDLCEIVRNVSALGSRDRAGGHHAAARLAPAAAADLCGQHSDRTDNIVNLLQNAIDAIREAPSDRHEIELRVRAAKGMGEVAVRDTGAGVSDTAIERMFEPFFTTKSDGLGMGLAMQPLHPRGPWGTDVGEAPR